MDEYKVLVCGGRKYGKYWNGIVWLHNMDQIKSLFDTLDIALKAAKSEGKTFVLIHGGAQGADNLSGIWAARNASDVTLRVYRADWDTYKKAAGPIRNQQMLDVEKPNIVIACEGGNGTAHMIKISKKAGIPVLQIK